MKLPLEISVRNLELSEDMKALIREKAEKLDNVYEDLISCRVRVDVPHRSQRSGVQYDVLVDLSVPGNEIVIRREPDEDLHVAIVNSFDVAQRRLKEFAEKQRGDVKRHEEKPVAKVSKLFPGEGYGFIMTPEGREVYFHENALLNVEFDALEIGATVTFNETQGEEGAQASSVTLA
jgi:ribosomal subunit interface protein